MKQYPTNLTDKQWQVIENVADSQHRKRKHPLRTIMNVVLYLKRTGCQWRMLSKDFPPHNTVFYYFNKWKEEGVIEEITDTLHIMTRKLAGGNETPSLVIIDSGSIKSFHYAETDRGVNENKKIKLCKENLVVDYALVFRFTL